MKHTRRKKERKKERKEAPKMCHKTYMDCIYMDCILIINWNRLMSLDYEILKIVHYNTGDSQGLS